MDTKTYHKALEKLGLRPSEARTRAVLGISERTCWRLWSGDQDIPRTIELLLRAYLTHGLPRDPE